MAAAEAAVEKDTNEEPVPDNRPLNFNPLQTTLQTITDGKTIAHNSPELRN